MHELSLSYATVESVLESVAHLPATRILTLRLRAGELSGVAIDAFRFSFPLAAAGTMLEGADLHIESEPVTVYCPACDAVSALANLRYFCCPTCGNPTGDVRGGKDFTIQSIEIETNEHTTLDHATSDEANADHAHN